MLTGSLESSVCDYSDAYILVKADIDVKRWNVPETVDIGLAAATQVAFKNCALFKDCRTEINETFVEYNLMIEYSDNYSYTSGSLLGFKRDEVTNNGDMANDNNAPSFKYKASIINNTEANGTKME